MPLPFCFDFGDRYIETGDWSLAFRVYTEQNVYTPDPHAVTVKTDGDAVTISADGFAWGGLQQRLGGRFAAHLRLDHRAVEVDLEADIDERIKGTAVLVHGVPGGATLDKDLGFGDLALNRNDLRQYPNTLRLPLFAVRHADGTHTAAASLDDQVRGKTFAMAPDGDTWVMELHHHEDARQWSTHQATPTWRIERTPDPSGLIDRRCEILERAWDVQPWDTRDDVPDWMRRVGLVLNLHGMHWTGFIFNDYADQLDVIRYVCERIDGRHVLAYTPAWDGRYNYNWPNYYASERMGGADGLKRMVEGAHELGAHVVPQMGAVSVNRRFLPQGLFDAASQDGYGNAYVKQVEWDGDHVGDTYRVNANIGHPGFRQFLFDCGCRAVDTYGYDGLFFDINQTYHNDPRFHITEGHRDLACRFHERYDSFLMFGENWYDALLGPYPFTHGFNGRDAGYLRNWADRFDRYMRITYHLVHPATGRGSTGVYESGFEEPWVPDPEINAIPAISFVEDTMADYREGVDERIEAGRKYITRMGIG